MAYAAALESLYRAIFVAQRRDRRAAKQITDGLADAMYPVWDASGKYLWFLASTDFGLRSQWLDMTSYDREETFGLYVAVLKKGEPSPLLPESDEDAGVGRRLRAVRGADAAAAARAAAPADQRRRPAPAPRRAVDRARSTSTGLQQRIISVPGVPERQYAQLRAGRGGHGVLPRSAAAAAPGTRRRQRAAPLPAERSQGRAASRRASPTTR